MLSLRGSQLTSLNGYHGKKGKQLDISHNLLNDLDGIASWSEDIKWLNASHNTIKGVKHLKTCTNINVLNLSHNKLTSVKGLSKLKGLNALILNNNELKNLDALSSLTELNTIVLSSNELDQVDVVSSLKKLQKFSASHNKLKHFPPLHTLKELKDLKLNGNEIEHVPDSFISACIRIKTLDLGNNRFKDFDSVRSLSKLPYLDNLNLKGNPLCGLENYHLKMREIFPKLKLLDFKKLADLFYTALTETSQKETTESLSKKLDSESLIQVLVDQDESSDIQGVGESERDILSNDDAKDHRRSPTTCVEAETAPTGRGFKSKKMKRKGEEVIDDVQNNVDQTQACTALSDNAKILETTEQNEEGPIKKRRKKKKLESLELKVGDDQDKPIILSDTQKRNGKDSELLVLAEDGTNDTPKCIDTSGQSKTSDTERGFKSKKVKRKKENVNDEHYVYEKLTASSSGDRISNSAQPDNTDSIKRKRKRKKTKFESDTDAADVTTEMKLSANNGREKHDLSSTRKGKTKEGSKKSSKTTGIVNIIKAPSKKKASNAFDAATLVDSSLNSFGIGKCSW